MDANTSTLKVRVVVKACGDWSSRVAAAPFEKLREGGAVLQGPIGRHMLPFDQCESLVLVGGGSAVASALACAQQVVLFRPHGGSGDGAGGSARPCRVWLVCVVPDRELLVLFDDDLAQMAEEPGFSVGCFETGATDYSSPRQGDEELPLRTPVHRGRPDLAALLSQVAGESAGDARIGVVVAGPERLHAAVLEASRRVQAACGRPLDVLVEPNAW
eukprot:m51a1_g14815 hypothetical protein (216) ;mRNA; r:610272-610919